MMAHHPYPVSTPAQQAAQRDDLRNHLIGYHEVPRLDIPERASLAELREIHNKVKTVRWCRITNSKGRQRYEVPRV